MLVDARRRRPMSSTMSILRRYVGGLTHRYGLSVFQASETMAAHHRNFKNEDQTITIHDPNSGKHITVPTLARGTHRKENVAEEKDF